MRKKFDVAVVGGSDLNKLKRQLGEDKLFKNFDYVFAENGLVAFKEGKKLPSEVRLFSTFIRASYNYLILIKKMNGIICNF